MTTNSTPATSQPARVIARSMTSDATSRGGTCTRTLRDYVVAWAAVLCHAVTPPETGVTETGLTDTGQGRVCVDTFSMKPGSANRAIDTTTMLATK